MTEYKIQMKGRNWIVYAPNGQNMGMYRYEAQAKARLAQLEEYERQEAEAAKPDETAPSSEPVPSNQ